MKTAWAMVIREAQGHIDSWREDAAIAVKKPLERKEVIGHVLEILNQH